MVDVASPRGVDVVVDVAVVIHVAWGAGRGWEGDGVVARCGKWVGGMVVGRKEQTWQWLHAVSRFGRGRAVSGISLLMFLAYKKPSWLSWLWCSNLFLWSWVQFSLIANLFLFH